MDFISVIAWLVGTMVAVLSPIILAHELGHYALAKLAGVRVEEFGLGYPPRLLRLWRGKGHLEVAGANIVIPRGFQLPRGVGIGSSVYAVARCQGQGTLILHQLFVADPEGDAWDPGRAPADGTVHFSGPVTDLVPGTLYTLNLLPIGGFVKMTGEEDPSDPRSLSAQTKLWRLAVLAGGPAINVVVAIVLAVGSYTTGLPDKWVVRINDVQQESAADAAGLQPGDIVLSAGGTRIEDSTVQLSSIIRQAPETPVDIVVRRGTDTISITAEPRRDSEGNGLLGIVMSPWPDRDALRRYPLPEAVAAGVNDMVGAVVMTLQVPARVIRGDLTPQEARPSTVVGISGVIAFALQQSLEWGLAFPVLQTAALISLALGLTNLLPLPALDGGRIFFVLVEGIRGRRISPEREAMFHFVGLIVLVGLLGLMMIQDIINPVIPWSFLK